MRQPGLAVGLFVCNTKGTPGQTGALTTELQMDDYSSIRSKLLGWYFSVSWSRMVLQQSVRTARENNWTNNYEELQLERLLDLEQFLKMTWDKALEEISSVREVTK